MKKTYRVEGMSCGGCVSAVERAIKASAPQAVVLVELEGGLVSVDGVDDDDELIRNAVEEAGFTFAGLG
jgi:copper chaperone